MATCRDIVTRALRMSGIISREEDASAQELADGVTILQSLYDGWLVGGMFGRLSDIYETGSYEASEGQRIFLDSGTVTLPAVIDEARKPRDLSAIEVFDPAGRKVWLWDRTAWVRIDDLGPSDQAPLSERGVNGLASCVAVAYAEEFGAGINQSAVMQARNFKTALSYKFGSERPVTTATYY